MFCRSPQAAAPLSIHCLSSKALQPVQWRPRQYQERAETQQDLFGSGAQDQCAFPATDRRMARTIDRRMREAKESCRRRGGTQRMPKEGPKRAREKRMGGWACSTRSRARRLVGLGTLGIQPVGRAPFRSSRRSRICGDCCQESKFGGLLCLGDQLCAPGEPCAPCAVPDAQVLGRCFVAASVHISFSSARLPACPRTILVNGRDSLRSVA